MRQRIRHLFSIFMVCAMVLSLLPTTVLAAGTLSGLYYSYRLYEYNPMLEETVKVSTGDEYDALWEAINEYEVYNTSKISNAEIPTRVDVPGLNNEHVSKDETTGFPQITYTYKDVEYTWLCTGYEVDSVVHSWTSDELTAGYSTDIDLSSKEGKSAFINYCWTREGRRAEDSSSGYETITLTFDFWTIIKETNGAGGAPALTLPDGCDLTKADYKLYGSNSIDESLPSRIANNIKNGNIELITTGDDFVDGSLNIEWPKGYYATFDEILKARYGYDYYYITITDGGYVWYGDASSWNTISGVTFNPLQALVPEEDTTLYAVYHSSYMPNYQPAEGYTLIRFSKGHTLEEESEWSKIEFNEVRTQITFSEGAFPTGKYAVPIGKWNYTVPAPSATSTEQNGEVYLDYSDGSFQWQCIGVRYRVNGQYFTLSHTNWNEPLQITFEDTVAIGSSLSLSYIWKEVKWGMPPTMYDVKYEFELPDELSETSGRRVFPVKHSDDNWGSYDAWDLMSGDGDFNQNDLSNMQGDIKASDVTVREGTTLVILANAPDNHSGYQDFRDFLAFNNNDKIYYEFAGWEDENGDVHQILDPVTVDELSDGKDTTITLKATWTPIESISEEMYQKAADTLRLPVLSADSDFASPVLVTQWTDTDPNTGTNNKLTGDPVILNKDDTLYYKMSAKLNSGLFGSSDSQHVTKGDCVELTFTLDVDPNLEFADSSSMTITYNNPNLKLVSTNFGSVSGPDADNNYVVTFDPTEVPKNAEDGLHLEFTVKIIQQPETDFNQQAGDPMEFSGFAFKLKDGVETDGLVIESTGNVTGHMDLDKISNAGYHHRFRYYQVRNQLQGNKEWQEFFGEAIDPTAYVHAMQFMDGKLADYDLSQDKMSSVTANTVKAYGAAITITPADITIYMGGDGGYDAVVGENGEIASSTNSLPHPLFTIIAPNSVNPENLTFTNGKTGEEEKTWKLVCDNPTSGGQKYYHFQEGENQNKVRVTYTDKNGTEHTSDMFDPSTIKDVYTTYTIAIYPGDNDTDTITAKDTAGKEYAISAKTGTLTVRAVKDNDPTSEIQDAAPTKSVAVGSAVAVKPKDGTIYTLNNTGVELPTKDSKPSLLFDSIIENEGSTDRTDALKDKVDDKLGTVGSNTTRHYEIKYLDLVDANNGNAWITSSAGTDIYWGYPKDTDKNTTFYVLHFEDLHRDGEESGYEVSDIESCTVTQLTADDDALEQTDYGIKFHVDAGGFSPFALVWETTSGGGGGGGTTYYTLTYESNGGTTYEKERYASGTTVQLTKSPVREGYTFTGWYADKELTDAISSIKMTSNKTVYAGWEATETPSWLNGDDHFAYVIGYDDGTVRPLDNITRSEVAAIFFRLLRDEVREEYLTESNTFADVTDGMWHNTAISTLAAMGILEGRSETCFDPNAPITRAEFAAICARFSTEDNVSGTSFTDIKGHWAEKEIQEAASLGWILGRDDGTFGPDLPITRAEAMTMINRVLCRLPETEDDLLDDMIVWPDNQPDTWYYLAVQEATNSHDFQRKDDVHERWTALRQSIDWTQYQ